MTGKVLQFKRNDKKRSKEVGESRSLELYRDSPAIKVVKSAYKMFHGLQCLKSSEDYLVTNNKGGIIYRFDLDQSPDHSAWITIGNMSAMMKQTNILRITLSMPLTVQSADLKINYPRGSHVRHFLLLSGLATVADKHGFNFCPNVDWRIDGFYAFRSFGSQFDEGDVVRRYTALMNDLLPVFSHEKIPSSS